MNWLSRFDDTRVIAVALMSRRFRAVACGGAPALFLGLSVLLCASPARAQPATEELDRWIDQAVAVNSTCVGLAVGVKKGQAAAARFFGTTGNYSAPTADTEFEIGSITKTFTATLLAWSDQQGRMQIDDALAKFSPSRVPSWQGEPIRLVHLADHTSGLPRQMPLVGPRQVPDAWSFLAHYQLTRAPGSQYLYSNLGVNILGLALERAYGTPLESLYAHVITGPLGMRDTAIELSRAGHARLALGFRPNGLRATERIPRPLVGGAGALNSTLHDMMRYLEFQLGEAGSPLDSLLPSLHQIRFVTGPRGGVGLGWHMQELADGTPIVLHEGAMPGYSSTMIFGPSSRTGVVVLSNQRNCGVPKIAGALIRRLNGQETLAEPMVAPEDDDR